MGKGISKYSMTEIIRIGFEELELEKIYWCVDKINERAIKFYDKNGYQRISFDEGFINKIRENNSYTDEQINKYLWYEIKKNRDSQDI